MRELQIAIARCAKTVLCPDTPPPSQSRTKTLKEAYGDGLTGGEKETLRLIDLLENCEAAWSNCPLGSAPARLLCLLRARLAALGDAPSQGEKLSHRVPRHCLECSS